MASADAVWGGFMNLIGSPKAERIRTSSDEALRATGLLPFEGELPEHCVTHGTSLKASIGGRCPMMRS